MKANPRYVEAIIVLLLVITSIVGICFLNFRDRKIKEQCNYAVLSIDGNIVKTFNLSDYLSQQPDIFDISNEFTIVAKLEFKSGAVRFVDVNCPDRICESQGFISHELQSAVCMPNKTALNIYTEQDINRIQ